MSKQTLVAAYAAAEKQGEEGYWSACRIAHEAVTTGGYDGKSFAAAVGKSPTYVLRQARIWEKHGSADERPSYTEALYAEKGQASTEGQDDYRVKSSWRTASPKAKAALAREALEDPEVAALVPAAVKAAQAADPDVARAIARNGATREIVEEEGIKARASRSANPELDTEKVLRKFRQGMRKAMNDEDQALSSLRLAIGFVKEAILFKEDFGHPDEAKEAEVLDQLDLAIRVYRAGNVDDEDRSWAESVGVEL